MFSVDHPVTKAVDVVAVAATVLAFLNWLPPLAALGALIWYSIQIWESKTMQHWYRARRQRRQSKKRVIDALIREREKQRGHSEHHRLD